MHFLKKTLYNALQNEYHAYTNTTDKMYRASVYSYCYHQNFAEIDDSLNLLCLSQNNHCK